MNRKLSAPVLGVIIALTALPHAFAQNSDAAPQTDQGGRPGAEIAPDDDLESWIGRGAQDLMRSLLTDIEPQLNDLSRELSLRFDALSPILQDLGAMVDDIGNYQAPERLPNGDILIRRKAEAPPPKPLDRLPQDLTKPDGDSAAPDGDDRRFPAPGPNDIEL